MFGNICAQTGSPTASSKITRYHRRRLRRMAQARRPTRNNHVNRYARLGAHRSVVMTLGIMEATVQALQDARQEELHIEEDEAPTFITGLRILPVQSR